LAKWKERAKARSFHIWRFRVSSLRLNLIESDKIKTEQANDRHKNDGFGRPFGRYGSERVQYRFGLV
jgi:hypothetical protein